MDQGYALNQLLFDHDSIRTDKMKTTFRAALVSLIERIGIHRKWMTSNHETESETYYMCLLRYITSSSNLFA